jgi:hypothetical protein
MSAVVKFLETLGRNPKPLSADDFATVVASADLDAAARQALLERDATALNALLNGRPKMMCVIAPAENDEPEQEEEREGEEDAPDSESSMRAA